MKKIYKTKQKFVNFYKTTSNYAIKLTAVIVVTFCTIKYTNAQTTPKLRDSTNQFIIDKAEEIDSQGGVIYYKYNYLKPGELFTKYIKYTGLGDFDSVVLVSKTKDSMLDDEDSPTPNMFHDKYQQYYKNIIVEGALYTEHHNGSCVWFTSGFLTEGLNLSVIPKISKSTALSYAISHVGAETYEWDSTGVEPKVDLVITSINENQKIIYKLAWKFNIHSINPFNITDVYVDANDGTIINEVTNIHFNGDFDHHYYGHKSDLDTKFKYIWWSLWDRWYLYADNESRNIYTSANYNQSNFSLYYWYWDDMTYISANSDNWGQTSRNATSAHYSISKAWDYFKQSPLNRNGVTGWGKHLFVASDCSINDSYFDSEFEYGTAYVSKGNDDFILVGNNMTNNNHLSTYDLMGHEFTHGIINNSSPLPNQNISGSINEAFSDIFGFMVERYMNNGVLRNWTIGEDANAIFRNIQNPNQFNHPSFYLQDNFYYIRPTNPNTLNNKFPNRKNDFFGVHINAGVMNKWFYLLSMGGNQTISFVARNSPPPQIRYVSGIGIDKAARIAFYAMTNSTNYNASNNLTFDVVRANTIAAAKKLYGICSNEYVQTCKAWYAVNVGTNCEACVYNQVWYGQEQAITTSIKESKNEDIKINIFPNPANDKIVIQTEETNSTLNKNSFQLNIADINGKSVYTSNYTNLNNTTIDINNFKSGVYFISISTDNWFKRFKFVKL